MNATSTTQAPVHDAAKSGGSSRLLVLLGLLAVMLGALAYDRLVAEPGKEKAKDRIDALVTSKSAAGIPDGMSAKDKAKHLPTDADIRDAIGFSPKWTKKDGDYTLQCFHWWGWIPLNRNYLIVQYSGTDPLIFVKYTDGELPKEPVVTGDSSGTLPTTMDGPPPGTPIAPPGSADKPADSQDKAGDRGPEAAATPEADKKPEDAKPADNSPETDAKPKEEPAASAAEEPK